MSINDILSSAVSGLAASQAGLRSVSNNIANVGVAGYARERVNLSTGVSAGRTSGVVVGEPTRVADRFLEATVYRRSGDYGRAEVTANYLDRLQSLLGQPGAPSGLPARLDAISASAVALTGSQSSSQTAAAFTADVQDAISSMQQLDSDVAGLRGDVESEVGYTVDKINSLLARIHDLNATVAQSHGLGRSSGGAADQRMIAIQELSSLVSVNVRDQPDGRVTIETTSGAMLLDKRLRQLSYPMSGDGFSQPVYPPIDIRFAEPNGSLGASTGERLDSAAAGGKLGGLLDLRDRALPEFSEQLGVLFGALAETLNSVSNASTTVPPPASLTGRETGLTGADRHGFTGKVTFAVTQPDGTLVASSVLDFDALPGVTTVDQMVAKINADLGGAGTATFADGKLTFTAAAGNGVVVAQDETTPSSRAGVGVAHYFGLNDLVRSDKSPLVPSGFIGSDPHGFAPGQTTEIVLRDVSGRALTSYTLTGSDGPTFDDLIGELQGSPLGDFGTFSLDDRGRIRFEPAPTVTGAVLSIPSDSTDRFGTGRSFSSLMGLSGAESGLSVAKVRADILSNPAKLPLARLNADAAVGEKALGPGDVRGATAFVENLGKALDLGKDGVATVERFSSLLLGRAGLQASQADGYFADATARRDDAINRRDSFSGVNVDEELAQMVVLQNSYAAAARVMTTATDMYDTLIDMIR